MIQQQLVERGYDNTAKRRSGIIDRRVADLDDIPKGYKIKCTICKEYIFVNDLTCLKHHHSDKYFKCKACKRK